MSDCGVVVDIAVAGTIVAAALGLLLVVPAVPLGRAEGPRTRAVGT